ncbi:C-X-C motif chemokine 11 [Protobothrops mucrosquamatus]|uniref:C-X-C motif chemokine 11 n=1 Tax=Protobothrops mucrosquamatus TaxID=103944 RepID=UPI000775BF90|nr:C-X-C motif chemokine 11 [Protobothrops mucrosquamatus]
MLRQSFLAVLVLLACCVALMQGMPAFSRERCLCNRWNESVRKNLMATAQYYEPNSRCSQGELIVTLRNKRTLCLNPNGEQGRRIKEEIMKQNNAK